MDMLTAVKAFTPNPEQPFRIRQAVCVSVQTGYTCTVTIAGDTVEVPNVRYMHAPPRPGTACFVATDGYEIFVLGQIAGNSALPFAVVERTTSQSVADGGAVLTFPTVTADPWGMFSAGVFTLPCDGLFVVEGHVKFAASATGNRSLTVRVGGVGPAADEQSRQQNVTAGTPAIVHTSRIVAGVKGAQVTMFGYQNTGGALNVTAASAALTYVGPAE